MTKNDSRNVIGALEQQRDVARLRAEIGSLERPWWRSGSVVATLVALVSATVPATTAVQEHYRKQSELALAKTAQEHSQTLEASKQVDAIRSGYLDRMDKDMFTRRRVLKFLAATSEDPALKDWAESEASRQEGEQILEDRLRVAELEAREAELLRRETESKGKRFEKAARDAANAEKEKLQAVDNLRRLVVSGICHVGTTETYSGKSWMPGGPCTSTSPSPTEIGQQRDRIDRGDAVVFSLARTRCRCIVVKEYASAI